MLCSIPAFVCMGPLLRQHLVTPLESPWCYALAFSGTLFTWFTVFGLLGLFLRYWHSRSHFVSYLSEASFWIYFLHVPVIGLLQTLLTHVPWPLGLKFASVLIVTALVCLATYEGWVRYSFVGGILTGVQKRRPELGYGRLALMVGTAGCLLVPLSAGVWYLGDLLWNYNFHPVVTNEVYRSARLPARQIPEAVTRFGFRSVVCLQGAAAPRQAQQPYETLGVDYRCLELDADRPPRREELTELVQTLDTCRRPVLLHDHWGMERASLAAAIADLLTGAGPLEALEQFSIRYGNLGAAPHARVVQDYQHWLAAHAWPHSPDRFRSWLRNEYVP
jgi:hypothetical protein